MKQLILFLGLSCCLFPAFGQDSICISPSLQHEIQSKALDQTRSYWVSLPLHYNDSLNYPVIYVFDAEWRFNLIRHIAFDLGGNDIIPRAIIVGIPHIDWKFQRGIDLTFSQSRIEYDGDVVDSTWYNASNSGGGERFYHYLVDELIPDVNSKYPTNGHETLVGHSYGGYFGGYLLSLKHPFDAIHIYDPAMWFSNGEAVERLKATPNIQQKIKIHLTYQPAPEFHRKKIKDFIKALKKHQNIEVTTQLYKDKVHNALFLDSFYKGILLTNP